MPGTVCTDIAQLRLYPIIHRAGTAPDSAGPRHSVHKEKACLAYLIFLRNRLISFPQIGHSVSVDIVGEIDPITGLTHQSMISFAVSCGQACHRQVTMPHRIGEANEVPLALRRLPFVPITSEFSPTATTSGFTRLSAVLPTRRKRSQHASPVIAPTVSHILRIPRCRDFLP